MENEIVTQYITSESAIVQNTDEMAFSLSKNFKIIKITHLLSTGAKKCRCIGASENPPTVIQKRGKE